MCYTKKKFLFGALGVKNSPLLFLLQYMHISLSQEKQYNLIMNKQQKLRKLKQVHFESEHEIQFITGT